MKNSSKSQNHQKMKAPKKAYSLVVVLLTLGLVTVALFCLLAFEEAGVKTSSDNIERRKMFYVCDGMTRIVAETLQGFMRTATIPAGAAGATVLKTYLERGDVGGGSGLPNLVPAGFTLSDYDISDYDHVGDAVAVPSGAFAGMVGKEDKLRITVSAERADRRFSCTVRKELSLTQVGLFQMTLWSALPTTRLWFSTSGAGAFLGITGRVHAQGDFFISDGPSAAPRSGVGLLETVTASGKIRGTGPCADNAADAFTIATAALGDPPPQEDADLRVAPFDTRLLQYSDPTNPLDVQGCTDAAWVAATGVANGHVADARLGVEPLRLPLPVSASEEANPLRMLIEPVVVDAATDERERHKFAYKADVRIIDGVWFVATPGNPADWPGLPVWSDHPGKKKETYAFNGSTKTIAVGQEDLRIARGWVSTPLHYSPYGYAAGRLVGSPGSLVDAPTLRGARTAVSYGATNEAGRSAFTGIFSPAGTGLPPTPADPGCQRALVARPPELTTSYGPSAFAGPVAALCGAPWTDTSEWLSAASWGFQDQTLTIDKADASTGFMNGAQIAKSHGNISPINFDIEGFSLALSDVSTGELGSYFRRVRRRFNGVVWISSQWKGALQPGKSLYQPAAIPSPAPPVPPHYYFGSVASVSPGVTPLDTPSESRPPLPYPLCSDAPGVTAGGLANTAYDDPAFKVHDCAATWYDVVDDGDELVGAFPNAVRITNAARVYQAAHPWLDQLPNGLTVATNLPGYVLGDTNVASTPATRAGVARAANWVPFAFAADNVALLGRVFRDWNYPWWKRGDSLITTPSTTYNMELLTGAAVGTGSCSSSSALCGDSVLTSVRLIEPWNISIFTVLTYNGSIVVGYHSAYVNSGFPLSTQEGPGANKIFAWPKSTNIAFDHNLNLLANQPPGTEALGIQSIRAWDRD